MNRAQWTPKTRKRPTEKIRGVFLWAMAGLLGWASLFPARGVQVFGQLKIGEVGMPSDFDPINVNTTIALRWSRLGNQFLLVENPLDGKAVLPELLADLQPLNSSDVAKGLYHFQIRPDAKWTWWDAQRREWQSRPVRADDILFSWEQIHFRDTSQYHAKAEFFQKIIPVGEQVVGFALAVPQPPKNESEKRGALQQVWSALSFPIVPRRQGPQSSDWRRQSSVQASRELAGSGPYQLESAKIGDVARYRGNPNYVTSARKIVEWLGEPVLFQRLEIEQMRDSVGETRSIIDRDSPLYQMITEIPLETYHLFGESKRPDVEVYLHNTNNFSFLGYNARLIPRKLRLAFTHAIHRADIYNQVYGPLNPEAQSATLDSPYLVHHPYPEALLGAVAPTRYSEVEAKKLIGEAMKDPNKAVRDAYEALVANPIELIYFQKDSYDAQIVTKVADQIRNLWKQVDPRVRIEVRSVPQFDDFMQRLESHNFQICYHKWSFQSGTDVVTTLFHEDSPRNYTCYNVSPTRHRVENLPALELTPAKETKERSQDQRNRDKSELNALLREHDEMLNPEMREQKRKEIAEHLMREAPYTFLFRVPYYMAYRKDFVKIHPSIVEDFNLFYYIFTWKPQ